MNKCIFHGHVAQDPELRNTTGGTSVLNLRIGVNERYKDKNGETQEQTEWINIVVWGKQAEGLATFLRKGMAVLAETKVRTRSYEKDGEKRYSTEFHADHVEVTTPKSAGTARSDGPALTPPPWGQ